ncbi:mannan polymerase [Neurospora intermedia]|uniref:Mannan polymerase n=1 Tax=Neurospora intermedia TaxID=5142 RepID=A0ABR3DGQ3_NEUIN
MLPYASSSGSKAVPRHHASGYSNGYPRGNTFEISPHRFQPRGAAPPFRRQKGLFVRLAIALVSLLLFGLFVWPGDSGSFSWLGSGSEDFQLETVRYYDLSNVQGTAKGWEREERILICVPLRDAEVHMPMFFGHLLNLTYPHHLIDLAFLVSDSKDNTLAVLERELTAIQASTDPSMHFGEISIIEKDFGQKVNQDVESRHGFAAQASRRKLMAQARNWLLSAALRPYHSWVYWRDVDVETAPTTILEDLMRHNKDVIVPNVWRPLPDWLGGEQPYDLNSWAESETALALADTLDEDAVIVEGYAEYATWRPHLAYLRDPYGDPDMEMEIDGVGGVSILAKAKVFRYGVHFPAFSFEKHAETEAFGKMSRRMGFSVVGLPHYTIWHLYEPSVDDIKHMEQMEQERLAREKEEKEKAMKEQKMKESFGDATGQWEKDKNEIQNLAMQENKKAEEQSAAGQQGGPADGPANAAPKEEKKEGTQ